jgi:hypothetical protein
MELNEFEYQMLDALLEAFDSGDQLTRKQVLALFGEDDAFAADMVQVLVTEELVIEVGLTEDHVLPKKLVRQAKASQFLENGGFANPKESSIAPQKPTWDEEHLKKRNTELQNETLRLQRTIREKDTELKDLVQKAGNSDKYKLALYAAVLVIAVLLIWIIGHAVHHQH